MHNPNLPSDTALCQKLSSLFWFRFYFIRSVLYGLCRLGSYLCGLPCCIPYYLDCLTGSHGCLLYSSSSIFDDTTICKIFCNIIKFLCSFASCYRRFVNRLS